MELELLIFDAFIKLHNKRQTNTRPHGGASAAGDVQEEGEAEYGYAGGRGSTTGICAGRRGRKGRFYPIGDARIFLIEHSSDID